MKSLMLALLWRLGVGLVIAFVGLILAISLGKWNIEYTWFSVLGMLCILVAAVPFLPGSRRTQFRGMSFDSAANFTEGQRKTFSSNANFSITMALIGAVNVATPIVVYYVTR